MKAFTRSRLDFLTTTSNRRCSRNRSCIHPDQADSSTTAPSTDAQRHRDSPPPTTTINLQQSTSHNLQQSTTHNHQRPTTLTRQPTTLLFLRILAFPPDPSNIDQTTHKTQTPNTNLTSIPTHNSNLHPCIADSTTSHVTSNKPIRKTPVLSVSAGEPRCGGDGWW